MSIWDRGKGEDNFLNRHISKDRSLSRLPKQGDVRSWWWLDKHSPQPELGIWQQKERITEMCQCQIVHILQSSKQSLLATFGWYSNTLWKKKMRGTREDLSGPLLWWKQNYLPKIYWLKKNSSLSFTWVSHHITPLLDIISRADLSSLFKGYHGSLAKGAAKQSPGLVSQNVCLIEWCVCVFLCLCVQDL